MNEWRQEPEIQEYLSSGPLWVFGYGSLLWNPGFRFIDSQAAVLVGYHRALCVWAWTYRGTPEKPGLVFGLAPGERCEGLGFLIAEEDRESVLAYLWEREMIGDVYHAEFCRIQVAGRSVNALTFIVNTEGQQYAGCLSNAEVVKTVLSSRGTRGENSEYVLETYRYLSQRGVEEPALQQICQLLQQDLDHD